MVFYFGRHLHRKDWFEKSIFAWGWWTGTMAMGIALLRIVDPKMMSKALDDYALAYLPCAPVEILLITIVPIMFTAGQGAWLMLICLAISAVLLFLASRLKWWIPTKDLQPGRGQQTVSNE
jgi:ESS family glutamate:Na+ symporter